MWFSAARGSYAWVIAAHVLGAAAIGALEAARLGSVRLALVLIPVFAVTGLVAGATIAVVQRAVAQRSTWVAAIALAAPSLIVTIPVASTLFDGSYARSLPFAHVLPYAAPVLGWAVIAVAVAVGRWLAAGDLALRSIALLATAGSIGAIAWAKRHVLGSGYRDAQLGATIAIVVLAGIAFRLARRARLGAYAAAVMAAIVIGSGVATATGGLILEDDRRAVATFGNHGRDLIGMWRRVIDRDRDGSSPVLGGGDCDDRDPARHPGAVDAPGDGVDQDCDGADAVPAPPAPPEPAPVDLASWRARPDVAEVLERTAGMNVLMITIDALRRDMLDPDAPDRGDFPRLAQLVDESVSFTRAIAPASGTDIALTTLLTGRFDPFQQVNTTLGEAIRARGRHTTIVVPGEVLRHVGDVMLRRGFDRVRKIHTDWDRADVGDHVSAPAVTDEGIRAINLAGQRPWLVWVHYFDVHEHHQIKVPDELLDKVRPGRTPPEHDYRALLFAIDRAVGALLDDITRRGQAERTIVVFASDHGESLKEDPRLGDTHGFVAYAPLVRIPLAIRIPGVAPGLRSDPVSLVDLAPTLLALAGAPDAIRPLDGIDLVPSLLDGPTGLRPPPRRAIAIHESQQWSVIEWPYQLLVRPADDLTELYDIERDPGAQLDLSEQQPEVTRRLRARFGEFPAVRVDRTADGRAWREQQARPPQRRDRP